MTDDQVDKVAGRGGGALSSCEGLTGIPLWSYFFMHNFKIYLMRA
jgi:hypothetical protein